jgi:hypothetical protein
MGYNDHKLNYTTIEDLVKEWKGTVNKIGFQFHTPFADNDPLCIPYGETRNKVIDNIIQLREKYPNFVMSTKEQLELMRGNLGGVKTSINCPAWRYYR